MSHSKCQLGVESYTEKSFARSHWECAIWYVKESWNICNRNVSITENPVSVSHASMQRYRLSLLIAFKNVKADCCEFSSLVVPDFFSNSRWSKTSTNWRRREVTHIESRSHKTNRFCCSKRIQAIAAENIPAQQITIRAHRRVHLRMMPFNHRMFFCSG